MSGRRGLRARRRQSVHLVDRLVKNIEHGRFERSLSALTGVGALVTGGEIFLSHDRAASATT